MESHIDVFKKILDDLLSIDVVLEEEDRAILLLNAFSKSFE